MGDEVILEIRDFGVISRADIGIGKVNVVGGINNSGKSTVSKLLYCFLKSQDSQKELLENEGFTNLNDESITFKSDSKFSDVFYLESISILDLKDLEILDLDHIKHIRKCLEIRNENVDDETLEMLDAIDCITGGDCRDAVFSSAGIKQISIIKMLLENKTLTTDSFLIIDEAESNLHPAWQIKFAHMLTLLAYKLNISLYLNSHSPIFIEAISLYSQYYGLLDDTGFYLSEKNAEGKFEFRKINPKNLGEVYENLTSPYDDLDNLKARILFRE